MLDETHKTLVWGGGSYCRALIKGYMKGVNNLEVLESDAPKLKVKGACPKFRGNGRRTPLPKSWLLP